MSVADLKRAVAFEGMTWCTAIELVMPMRKVNECNVIDLISMMLPIRTAKQCLEVLSACQARRMPELQRSQQLKSLTYRSLLRASARGMIDPGLKFRIGELSLILF